MKGSVAVLLAIGLAFVATPASAQRRGNQPRPPDAPPGSGQHPGSQPRPPAAASPPMKTASEGYWDAVHATSGPIGFPQPASGDKFTRPSRPRPPGYGYGSAIYGSALYEAPQEPVYVPVYVPGPVVYVPVPAEPPPPAPADSAPAAPRRPEKFYIIPGCYAGNKPPQANALPAGCDIQKLHTSTW